jgi:hypothetical protein
VKLDSSHKLLELRNSVAERKARADQLASLLQLAESARDTGELEEAQKAVVEALHLDRDNREAQALNAIIAREIEERNKLKQVQGFLDEARKRMASRQHARRGQIQGVGKFAGSSAHYAADLNRNVFAMDASSHKSAAR